MANRIKDLREKQARLVEEARERLDQITSETDEARAKELEEQHDAAMAEHDRLEKQIEREERLAGIEKRHEERMQQDRERRRPVNDTEGRGSDEPGDGVTYREVFAQMVCGVSPVDMTSEERATLQRGATNFEQRIQTGAAPTGGGYTVPTELANEIIRSMAMWGPMYDENICTVMNTASGNPIPIPTVNDTANEAAEHTEGADLTDDGGADVVFGQKTLNAYSYDTEFIRWSWELDMDSIFNMETLLGSLLGERLGRIANRRLTTGTGADAPHGVATAVTVGKTTAGASAITWDEIMELEHSVDPAYRASPKCRYMFNDNTLLACRKLKDGQGNYLWQKGNVQEGTPALFNNKPYSINQHMASIGTGNRPMVFGDFGKYFVRKVGSPVIGVLRERFWPQLGIAGLIRFDGELGDTAAIKAMANA